MRNTGRYRDGSRSSIGEDYMRQAITKLDRAMKADIADATKEFTVADATRMLFRDEDIALITRAAPLLYNATKQMSYSVRPHANCDITISFKAHPAPSGSAKFFQADRAEAFLEIVKVIQEKRRLWGKVKYVLRWLNSNATPGAIRALWPSALQLCKNAPVFKDLQETPKRYATPPNVGPMLQLFRETATTVALMSMMPDTMVGRPSGAVYVMFPGETIDEDSVYRFYIDSVVVGLDDPK